jgi:hypothetical protein
MPILTGSDPTTGRALRGAILVEGPSDKIALETLARRRGRNLADEAVAVIEMGGVTNIGRHLEQLGNRGIRLAGLCDLGDVEIVMSRLRAAGPGSPDSIDQLEGLGFYVCRIDLEDELVRALGPERVLQVFERDGRLHKFRTFQTQVEKRLLPLEVQLWDYLTNWKIHYAGLFVEALDLDQVPRPLDGVLSQV